MNKLIALSLLFAGSLAFAEQKKPAAPPAMAPPVPPAELKALDFFNGDWACEGKHEPGPMGPGFPTKNKVDYKWELGNFWMTFSNEQEKTKENPMAHGARGFITFDPGVKKFTVAVFFPGPGWVNATSAGWEGDKMVWVGEGNMMGKKMNGRHTQVKKGADEYSSTFEMQGPDGKWMKTGEEICKRAKK